MEKLVAPRLVGAAAASSTVAYASMPTGSYIPSTPRMKKDDIFDACVLEEGTGDDGADADFEAGANSDAALKKMEEAVVEGIEDVATGIELATNRATTTPQPRTNNGQTVG